ncbi:MAG: squalene/phytoene synthase family protein [Polyangiales bacterium]
MSDDLVVRASQDVLARHARSFKLASLFLPASCRADAAVCYALCRLADDLADEATDAAAAREALDALDAELAGDRPARPLVAAWRAVAARCAIPCRQRTTSSRACGPTSTRCAWATTPSCCATATASRAPSGS